MRIAILADIHGNLTAFEAVLRDLEQMAPDLIVHGGDLATHGHRPAEVVDRIRDAVWPGVVGNTDEMLWRPEQYEEISQLNPALIRVLFQSLAPATRSLLGETRVEWLKSLPSQWRHDGIALVHAAPGDLWRAPMPDATDEVLRHTYKSLKAELVVYCHIHRPYIRPMPGITVCNTGSVGMPLDGDRRASYLLVDSGVPQTKRVEYDVEAEIRGLLASTYPQKEIGRASCRERV